MKIFDEWQLVLDEDVCQPITDLTLDNVKGTASSSGTDIYILCGSGSCSDWTWESVSVTGGKISTACENVPSGASCSD
jgi:polygalacturonase